MSFSRIPNDLQECILERVASYKIRLAFAKALLGYFIKYTFKKCDECNIYKTKLYTEDRCADGVLGTSSCCYIYICEKCKDILPLECGHKISKEEYEPQDTDYDMGYYCHNQMCNVCNKRVKVIREWWGLSPKEWFKRY